NRPIRPPSTPSSTRISSAIDAPNRAVAQGRQGEHQGGDAAKAAACHSQPLPIESAKEPRMIDTSHLAFGIAAVLALVFANGFFVAAEFSLVTVRKTRIDQLISEGHRGARTVRRALDNPNNYIASTQLGITMASLGLGWV